MYGQMKKYNEILKKMNRPIELEDMKQKLDLRGVMDYAEKKGVKVSELSAKEKKVFLK